MGSDPEFVSYQHLFAESQADSCAARALRSCGTRILTDKQGQRLDRGRGRERTWAHGSALTPAPGAGQGRCSAGEAGAARPSYSLPRRSFNSGHYFLQKELRAEPSRASNIQTRPTNADTACGRKTGCHGNSQPRGTARGQEETLGEGEVSPARGAGQAGDQVPMSESFPGCEEPDLRGWSRTLDFILPATVSSLGRCGL